MSYGSRVERTGFHPVLSLGSSRWCLDCVAGMTWTTSHRGEGMSHCKISTATRFDLWRPMRRVLVLLLEKVVR